MEQMLSESQRLSCEFILMYDDFRVGHGDERQKKAFREYEFRRIEDSVVYFIQHYGYLANKDGTIARWHLWDFQDELFRAWQDGESTCAVKARQLGVTTCSSHYALWEVITKAAVKWYAISQNEESAKDLISRIQPTLQFLPQWILEYGAQGQGVMTAFEDLGGTHRENGKRRRRKQSEGIMRFVCGLSQLLVLTSTPESTQGKAGKFILDEFTKHKQQKSIWGLVKPSFEKGGQCIMIANGHGKDTFYYIYQQSKKDKTKLKARFYAWWHDPDRDKAWYETEREAYLLENPDSDEFDFMAQYPSDEREAFFLTGNSRFSLKIINNLEQQRVEEAKLHPEWPQMGILETGEDGYKFVLKPKGKLTIWEYPEPDGLYVMGADSSGGRRDSAVADVYKLNFEKMRIEQVAQFRAVMEPEMFGAICRHLGFYYNEALICPESNNHGMMTIKELKTDYVNLYMRLRTDKFTDEEQEVIGYNAQGKSKESLIDGLSFWLASGKIFLRSEKTLDELSKYEIKENNTTSAPAGEHDDCVIACGCAQLAARDLLVSDWDDKDANYFTMGWGEVEDLNEPEYEQPYTIY